MLNRPLGVLILSVLATLAGFLYLLAGIQLMGIVTFGPAESGNGVWISGLFTFIVGLIWLGVGGALWSLQAWGLLFTEIMAVFALISGVFTLFAGASVNRGLGLIIIPIVILWYANRESIKAAFAQNAPK